jgi:hypothetical protein
MKENMQLLTGGQNSFCLSAGSGRERVRRMNMVQKKYTGHVNAKMILLKLFQESGEGTWKRAVEGINSSMIYMIHCKNLCKKCYNVPPPRTIIKKKQGQGDW